MKFFILIQLFLLVFLSGNVNAASPDLLFEAGNREYLDGQYNEALDKWLQIENDGFENSALYYNIGNAYYKLSEVGESILYWEKALKFASDDEDITTNLKIARTRLVDKLEEQVRLPVWNWLDKLRARFSPELLAIGASGLCFLLFLIIGIRRWLIANNTFRKLFARLAWLVFVVLILDFAFIGLEIQDEKSSKEGVLIVKEAEILSAPAEGTGKLLFTIHEGTKVKVLRSMKNWHEISLGKKKHGWVKGSQLGII